MYKNPILYCDYSDPDAIRVADDYFMVASSFSNAPGIPVLHSKDLINWKVVNYVLDEIPAQRYEKAVHGCGVWAPSIRYHEGTYYVCFPMPDEGIYMATTTDPFGKWSVPVNIRPGAGWIDPCPFWDDDGKAYLVAGVAKSRIGYKSVLHIVPMANDGMSLIGSEVKIFDGNENDQTTIEGPKMYKRNGWYYIFAPAGGVKTGWQTVLRSKNVYGPYEYRVVMRQGDTPINGPHQGAWVDTVTGQDWFIHFQDVYAAGRITHLQPMHWENDWPIIGVNKCGFSYGEPVLEYNEPDVGGAMPTKVIQNFDKLGLEWQWNANPCKSWYCIADNVIRLNAVEKHGETAYADVPNLLLQKWQAPEFCCITKLNLTNLTDGDEAGVISLGTSYTLLTFRRQFDCATPFLVKGTQKFGKILVEDTIEEAREFPAIPATAVSEVFVKYSVNQTGTIELSETKTNFPLQMVSLSYSLDGTTYTKAGSMQAVPGRWVGVKNGVFCTSNKAHSQGYVLVDYVKYT